jgi:hypothetical protein
MAASVGNGERLTAADADRECTVWCLDDGDLLLAEILDADKASRTGG